jgi:hypothetical protein
MLSRPQQLPEPRRIARPLAYAADEHADMFQALRLLTVLA